MTPLRKRLMRALALAVVVVALTAGVAAASDEEAGTHAVPYDPGLQNTRE